MTQLASLGLMVENSANLKPALSFFFPRLLRLMLVVFEPRRAHPTVMDWGAIAAMTMVRTLHTLDLHIPFDTLTMLLGSLRLLKSLECARIFDAERFVEPQDDPEIFVLVARDIVPQHKDCTLVTPTCHSISYVGLQFLSDAGCQLQTLRTSFIYDVKFSRVRVSHQPVRSFSPSLTSLAIQAGDDEDAHTGWLDLVAMAKLRTVHLALDMSVVDLTSLLESLPLLESIRCHNITDPKQLNDIIQDFEALPSISGDTRRQQQRALINLQCWSIPVGLLRFITAAGCQLQRLCMDFSFDNLKASKQHHDTVAAPGACTSLTDLSITGANLEGSDDIRIDVEVQLSAMLRDLNLLRRSKLSNICGLNRFDGSWLRSPQRLEHLNLSDSPVDSLNLTPEVVAGNLRTICICDTPLSRHLSRSFLVAYVPNYYSIQLTRISA